MNTIHEPARDVPVATEVDVCVVGGSCTGVFAAVTAARLGARVAIVEANGLFGGVATAGLVNIWHSLHDTTGTQPIIAGLTAEVLDRLHGRGAVEGDAHFRLNPAELTIELDQLVTEAHVRPFLHARFTAPVVEDGRLTAVIIEDKTGRRAIRAARFIDATGDADVVARLGLSCRTLDDLQPPTTCALVMGLTGVCRQNPGFNLQQAVFDPQWPEALALGFLWSTGVPGLPDVTMVAGTRVAGADCADADALTAAEIEGRRQVRAITDVVRRHFAGGDRVGLAALPAYIGIRETRHVEGLHRLTTEQVLSGERFPDAIANGTYPVDVHHSDKPGITFRQLDGTQTYHRPGRPPEQGRWRDPLPKDPTFYQIPYRSLVPRGATNLLVAGRSIDADRGAYGAIRVMVNCNQTGQAAGAAAWLALDGSCSVTAVDPARLRGVLADQGAAVV